MTSKRDQSGSQDFLRITLTKAVTAEAAEALDRQYFNECLRPVLLTCTDADPGTYASITWAVKRLMKALGPYNKPVILIGSPADLSERFQDMGTHSLLGFANSEKEALELVDRLQKNPQWPGRVAVADKHDKTEKHEKSETGTAEHKKASVQVNVINPFLNSTMQFVKITGGGDVRAGSPGLKEKDAPLMGDVSGIIPIVGREFKGAVVLSFPEKTLQGLLKKMLGSAADLSPEDLRDGAAEVLNIIFTRGKALLNEQGQAVSSAIPQILPKDLSSRRQKVLSRVAIGFESDLGAFTVEIWTEAA